MKKMLLLLVLLSACSGAVIEEEWPENSQIVIDAAHIKEFEEKNPEPITGRTFSLVKGRVTTLVKGNNHTITLLGATNESAQLRLDATNFILQKDQSLTRKNITFTILELAPASVAVPRKSFVDISASGQRKLLYPSNSLSVGNNTLFVDFIGLQDDVPKVRVQVGKESAILSEKEEAYFSGMYVYVHGVYFNDATEFDMVDAITLRVR